jgi:hypothetical protein
MHTTNNPILNGTLAIREINGRNGPFKVGTLQTSLGEFAVKDSLLDQYDSGTYEGEFQVERIFQGHYIAGGRSVTEIRAQLANISINDIDAKAPTPIEVEPDPIDSDKPQPAKESKPEAKPESSSSNTENDDNSLFALLMPLGESIKLDPSVDRKVLRVQTVRLKEIGYEFDAKSQTWKKPSIH